MEPYSIEIFLPDGDPEGIQIVSLKNWTGIGCVFPRQEWKVARNRPEFGQTGIYILTGHQDVDEEDVPGASALPLIYIGQTDDLRNRLNQHYNSKDFWHRCVTFVSSNNFLNRAHVTWLEWALYHRAASLKQCKLENNQAPQESSLSEADKADMKTFLRQVLMVLPIVNITAFEEPKAIHVAPHDDKAKSTPDSQTDTIIVPAKKAGFEQVFLGEDCWYAIRIGGGKLEKIKHIAAYQTQPISAITHIASVDHIEPYGDQGKYKVVFTGPAQEIKHNPFGDAKSGSIQGPKYTSKTKLDSASKLTDVL